MVVPDVGAVVADRGPVGPKARFEHAGRDVGAVPGVVVVVADGVAVQLDGAVALDAQVGAGVTLAGLPGIEDEHLVAVAGQLEEPVAPDHLRGHAGGQRAAATPVTSDR